MTENMQADAPPSRQAGFVRCCLNKSKCAMIVTTKADAISRALSEHFQSSGTIISAVGGYTKEEKQIIYLIVNQFQIYKIKRLVQEIDASAFIFLQDVTDIIKKKD